MKKEYEGICKQYLKARVGWRHVFIDVLDDLIHGINSVEDLVNICIENHKAIDAIFTPEDKEKFVEDFKIGELSGFFIYKKVDKFSNEVKNEFNTTLSSTISYLAVMRGYMIQELLRAGIISDLQIDIEKVCEREKFLKHFVKGKKRGEYELNKNALQNTDFEKKIKTMFELAKSPYQRYKSKNLKEKSVFLRNFMFELFVENKKELSYAENSWYSCLELVQKHDFSNLEVPPGVEPGYRALQAPA